MLWSPELVCSFSFLCADFFLKPFVIYCLPLPIKFPQPISLVYTLFSLWFLYNWDSFRIDIISHSWPVWSHWTGVRGRENQVHGICFRKILSGLDWCVLSECSFFTWPSNSVDFICVSREYTITYARRKWNTCVSFILHPDFLMQVIILEVWLSLLSNCSNSPFSCR